MADGGVRPDEQIFNPSNGQTNKTVTGQGALTPGVCYSVALTSVTVTYQ